MLVVLVYVPVRAEFGHPLQHPFQALQPAHDLPEPAALLHKLYTVVAADVYIAGGGWQPAALSSPQLRLLLSS
jgi:hypothetical protein